MCKPSVHKMYLKVMNCSTLLFSLGPGERGGGGRHKCYAQTMKPEE